MKRILVLVFVLMCRAAIGQHPYWGLLPDGRIEWKERPSGAHVDHIEMSGKRLSAIVHYGVDAAGQIVLTRKLIFPMLRTIPNNTRGNLIRVFDGNYMEAIRINGQRVIEKPVSFSIHGDLQCISELQKGVLMTRKIFPSVDRAAYIESYVISNTLSRPVNVDVPALDSSELTDASKGVYGGYTINRRVYGGGRLQVPAGASRHFWLVITARKQCDDLQYIADRYEWDKRRQFIKEMDSSLVLRTPDPVINRMFGFAKIRAAESIYETKAGLMHGPGGGEYYAAIWANDQAEYINPFFAYLGSPEGLESARNSYRLFATYMNPAYKPIPSSIIAEGTGFWNGAGDRGDQAMIGYGAAQFALTCGDTMEANDLWPLVKWCNTFLLRKKNKAGVITSDSDELEGRFPAGKANLSTNCLAYGSLSFGARLATALGQDSWAELWRREADALRKHIEAYFGGNVEGFKTYKYFSGNTKLRSWICLPLVMGINDRKQQTAAALLSPALWSDNGLLTAAGSTTYWDRSTLYAFRGLFKAGLTDTAMRYMTMYSNSRLLGDHVPYAIEAWPEGNQRHLSAESGLYCRAIVEGLMGFEPQGFRSFSLCPRLPEDWDRLSLSNMHAFNTRLTFDVQRKLGAYQVTITEEGKAPMKIRWSGERPIDIKLP